MDGRPLAGSPFPLTVGCDETAAGACKLFGVGLTHAVAGEPTAFGIQGARPRRPALHIPTVDWTRCSRKE